MHPVIYLLYAFLHALFHGHLIDGALAEFPAHPGTEGEGDVVDVNGLIFPGIKIPVTVVERRLKPEDESAAKEKHKSHAKLNIWRIALLGAIFPVGICVWMADFRPRNTRCEDPVDAEVTTVYG